MDSQCSMKFKTTCLGLLLVLSAAPSWAIYKCTEEGRTVFQEQACADGRGVRIDVRPASGAGPDGGQPAAQTRGQTEADRLNALTAQSQRDRRIVTLDARLIPDAQSAIDRKRYNCDQEMTALKNRKMTARNNLAGATWEQSLSTEMTAVATRCDTELRLLQDDLSRYQQEASELKRSK